MDVDLRADGEDAADIAARTGIDEEIRKLEDRLARNAEDPLASRLVQAASGYGHIYFVPPEGYELLPRNAKLAAVTGDKEERKAKQLLAKTHTNLSHPPNPTLERMLAMAGARESVLALVRRLRCKVCAALQVPPNHPVAGMALAQAFLRDYPDESSFFESLRESLRSHLLPARRSFRIDRFKARNEAYALLETDGPARLGRALLKADHPERKLEDAGLVGELANGVFVQRAVVRMLDLLSKVLVEERDPDQATAAVTKVIGFLYPDGVKGESRMPALRTCLAESLLIPYEKVDPSPSVQKVIQPFLLDAYGDPRTGHGAWHGVDVRAVSVLKSWLVTATLEDFFRLVRDICNRDASADRMWRYREAFWTAYLNKGVIGDAWVTLAEQSRLYARWLLGNEYSNSYGELKSGYNVKPNHAVLILRIGDLVITEWSHSGSYRLWHTDDPNCPKLYKQRYRREDLVTHPLLARAHHGASNGTWQAQLAKEIAEREMIRIRPKDYMPHA